MINVMTLKLEVVSGLPSSSSLVFNYMYANIVIVTHWYKYNYAAMILMELLYENGYVLMVRFELRDLVKPVFHVTISIPRRDFGKSVPTFGCFARLPRARAVFLAIFDSPNYVPMCWPHAMGVIKWALGEQYYR